MAKRKLKDWLKAYINHTAHLESPDSFHFWTGVSCIAAALRRRVWISQAYFEWTPNFYIIFVAPPGIVSKSTTINVGMSIVKRIEGIKFGPEAITWQALVMDLAASTESVLMPDTLYHPMSCVTIAASELGTLFNPKDREMVDVLVDLWDGKRGVWRKVTKMSGDDAIENPWINIIACTTPGWIADNMPESLIGGGFTSRCMFVFADKKRQLIAYPANHIPSDFIKNEQELLHDLEMISLMCGEYKLSSAAHKYGEKWYEHHYANIPQHLNNERFGGYIARKQTHMHKLAMILAASEGDSLVIHPHHLENANEIVTSLEGEMVKVFERIGLSDNVRIVHKLLAVVKSYKQIERASLARVLINVADKGDFENALGTALAAGLVTQRQHGAHLIIQHEESING